MLAPGSKELKRIVRVCHAHSEEGVQLGWNAAGASQFSACSGGTAACSKRKGDHHRDTTIDGTHIYYEVVKGSVRGKGTLAGVSRRQGYFRRRACRWSTFLILSVWPETLILMSGSKGREAWLAAMSGPPTACMGAQDAALVCHRTCLVDGVQNPTWPGVTAPRLGLIRPGGGTWLATLKDPEKDTVPLHVGQTP